MTSFNTKMKPERREVARFIAEVQDLLQTALMQEAARVGMTQQQVADRLGVDKALVSRWLSGANRNMTVETLALLGHALNRRIRIAAEPFVPVTGVGANWNPDARVDTILGLPVVNAATGQGTLRSAASAMSRTTAARNAPSGSGAMQSGVVE